MHLIIIRGAVSKNQRPVQIFSTYKITIMDSRRTDHRNDNKHLFRLGALDDYKVASNDPDVRQWDIVDRDGYKFGIVFDLIVDIDEEKVRYLDVLADDKLLDEDNGHILVPIGAARIDDQTSRVVVNALDKEVVRDFPVYKGDVLDRDFETDVVNRFNTDSRIGDSKRDLADFYGDQLFDQDRFYSNRNRGL